MFFRSCTYYCTETDHTVDCEALRRANPSLREKISRRLRSADLEREEKRVFIDKKKHT